MSVIYVNGIKTSCIALPMKEERTILADWDFKTSLVDSVHGNTITFTGSGISRSDQYGLVFAGSTNGNAQARIPLGLLQLDTIYELKMGACDPKFPSNSHGRIFSFRRDGDTGNTNHGLAYRHQTGVWSIWDADNLWQDSTITDKDFFSNCLLTIRIGADNNWYIYKDNEFVFKTTAPMTTGIVPNIFCLGANNQSFYDMNIESLKIYKVKYSQGGGGSGPSNYATGSFTSGSASQQKVEVNCGFQPDVIMVDMDFGNNTHTCATYFKTSNGFESSLWDLRPMEDVVYAITLGSTEGETGITDITSTGFKYRCNASNTQNKACTYIAIKY